MHCNQPIFRCICRYTRCLFVAALWVGAAWGTPPILRAAAMHAGAYAGKKIVWVSSCHPGYEANDDIARGIHAVLDPTDLTLTTLYLDTKRNNSEAYGYTGTRGWDPVDAELFLATHTRIVGGQQFEQANR